MPHGIDLTLEHGVAVVRIHRPSRRNALHGPAWRALGEVVRSVPSEARAIIVTGSDSVFSAGMDLKMDNPLLPRVAQGIMGQQGDQLREVILELKSGLAPLREAAVPTIAAIEGPCLGGGLEIALHCDVRVASESAVLSMPEPRLGFVADVGGTTLLRRLVGPGRATWLITSGRRIPVQQAERWGLVEQTCEPGTALSSALALALDMAKGAPVATQESLMLLRSEVEPLEDAFARETDAGVRALLSGELLEAVGARSEGRLPRWAPTEPNTAG